LSVECLNLKVQFCN